MLAVAMLAPGSATAARKPKPGFWSGSAAGTTVSFVVSRVRRTTVLSDLTIHCEGAYGVAEDEDSRFLHEAAIDRAGHIKARAKPFKRDYPAPSGSRNRHPRSGISGRLRAKTGVVSVDTYLALPPEGHPSSTGNYCPGTKKLKVARVPDWHLMRDGVYAINGTGAPATARIYGGGAAIEWKGEFRTPVGAEPDPRFPDLSCAADAEITASQINWEVMFAATDGAFSGSGGEDYGAISMAGRYTGPETAQGTWSAVQSFPFACSGEGSFTMTLVKAAPPLVPMKPARRHRHRHRR